MCPLSEALLYLHDFGTIPVPLRTCKENCYYQNNNLYTVSITFFVVTTLVKVDTFRLVYINRRSL